MKNYYFTYGSSPQYPFCGGWTVVVAEDKRKAMAAFRAYHEDAKEGVLNCAFVYDQAEMEKSGMLASGNEGEFCRERIVLMNDREWLK